MKQVLLLILSLLLLPTTVVPFSTIQSIHPYLQRRSSSSSSSPSLSRGQRIPGTTIRKRQRGTTTAVTPLSALPFLSELTQTLSGAGLHIDPTITTITTTTPPIPTGIAHSLTEHISHLPSLLSSAVDTIAPSSSSTAAPLIDDVIDDGTAEALGNDLFIFLVVSVIVVPLCRILSITPVLGFLFAGCLMGPYGLNFFSNTSADVQLGDFGILFLLFNEGLSLTPERIKELAKFTGLGVFQLLFSIGMIFVGTLWGGPTVVSYTSTFLTEKLGIPFDDQILGTLFSNPVEAFCIAAAGALSSSAFVLPVLEKKGWKEKPEGVAGLAILLLQDLSVAPLLVLLPLLAGKGGGGGVQGLEILVAKATLGFGSVLIAGSYALRYFFDVVATARSTETFVAAALLAAVGTGRAAEYLGLSDSTGAFAAGVLLAGNRYRAQIQADVRPFEGILLGVFFITAGAGLDPRVVVEEWPLLFGGIFVFVAVKVGIIFSSGPALGLTTGQAARVAFTLAGGGEFALVLFQLAQDLRVLPAELSRLLIASVIISMSLTPLLGDIGSYVGTYLEERSGELRPDGLTVEEETSLFDQIDEDGSGTIELDELRNALVKLDFPYASIAEVFRSFDVDQSGTISREEWGDGIRRGLLSDALGADSGEALSGKDVKFCRDAMIICGFGEVGKSLYNLLRASNASGASTGGVVCFDLNPARVTSGVLAKAPVVFGDPAQIELLRAAGIKAPRAVVITYATDNRSIEATRRLRTSLPDDTPIYVFEGNSRIERELKEAGATEVVSATTETILRFASLVADGDCEGRTVEAPIEEDSRIQQMRALLEDGIDIAAYAGLDKADASPPGLSEEFLTDLAEEIGCTRSDIGEFWLSFRAVAEDRDSVPIEELKEMLMRLAEEPSDGTKFEVCLGSMDEDGARELTFVEYCRALYITCSIDY